MMGGRLWVDRLSRIVIHIGFWLVLASCGAALSYICRKGITFGGIHPIPLRANPALLAVGILALPAVALVAWIALRRNVAARSILAIFALSGAFLALGVIVTSVYPGPGMLAARDFAPAPELVEGTTIFAMPFFFDNGSPTLSDAQKHYLTTAFSVFRSCERDAVYVRGFASSKAFAHHDKTQSNELNKSLANERAMYVKVVLEKVLGAEVREKTWDSYDQMVNERRLRDTSLDGESLPEAEKLNRRVEIVWSDSVCTHLGDR